MNSKSQKIVALLGPTNTGKTHVAIEKMLEFNNGIFGLPLRLLAREVYDKCVNKVGLDKVALITGEEKIIPSDAKYFLCTVESMPIDKYFSCFFKAFINKYKISIVINKFSTIRSTQSCPSMPCSIHT
mgnify:CR=1 FL=1